MPAEIAVADEGSGLAWGVSAMTLKPPFANAPSADDLLTNDANTVCLDHFYRAGGAALPSEPTECRIAYDANGLMVVFRCAESDMAFPAIHQNANWYSLLSSPDEQDSAFPDKVDFFIRPDLNKSFYYQFAVTLGGLKFGCKRRLHSVVESGEDDEEAQASARMSKVDAFDATVSKGTNEWIVLLRIPWQTIGGRPRDGFGILPSRTRWRNGEVSSPVAFDFTEHSPMDLFIETHFSGAHSVEIYPSSLCRLPSGILRWQEPALLDYPDAETVRRIWQMEQSLGGPTSVGNFAERLYLTQRWTDLLTLEGFNFRTERGSIVETNLAPSVIRRRVNAALQAGELPRAYRSLDVYLRELDGVSIKWFADGSPGDIGEWKAISKLEGIATNGNVLLLHCLAGNEPVELHLSLPKTGGVRIYGNDEGYFKPAELLPLNTIKSLNSCALTTPSGRVIIRQNPFTISMDDGTGRQVLLIGPGDIAFRFNGNGKIIAADFKNDFAAGEVIYGFGERYDRFNENGNVLTLWGMDDWFGNTVGLMNQTYKPIALFHSSKGYTVFDNSTYRLRADIGKTNPRQYRLTQQGPIFDYYFWPSPPEKAIVSYTALTGKPVLPPVWAFEPWMGRTGRGWNAPSHNPVDEEEKVTERFAELDIPHSAIYAEGPSAESPELNRFMAARGIKVLSWFWPVISESEQAALLPEIKADELPILNAGNAPATRELGYVDFTNPNALELLRRRWRGWLDAGVAGSMVDFGDRVPESAVFYNGQHGGEIHNFYAYDYHRICAEVFREARGNDFILFGRAAAPGDQRWVAQFAGDHPSNFPGLQSVLTGALNLCACGFSIWGSDMGGFLGWPEPAVYMRWTQFACFSPLMRCHGRTPREPWNYGDAAVANYKYFAWVRENLLDYIYNAAADSHETGVPMMRSLAMAFPDDPSLAAVHGQYMFGGDLLVAPVVTEDNRKTIFFPRGKWTSLWTGKVVSGPANVSTQMPLNTIPVYLKPGAIVPVELNHSLQFGQSMSEGGVKALIVTPPARDEHAAFHYDVALSWPRRANEISGATAALQQEANGFAVTLKNFKIGYLLVYGINGVSSIKVNGFDLPEETGQKFAAMSSGWEADLTENRLVICLPSGRVPRGRPERIQVVFRP